jgi:hypothetical protein
LHMMGAISRDSWRQWEFIHDPFGSEVSTS